LADRQPYPVGDVDNGQLVQFADRNIHEIKQAQADLIVAVGPGVLHTVTISEGDAAPTAGTIDIYDGTSAVGTKLFTWTLTTAVFNPISILLDVKYNIGLFIDFTTTADVSVAVTYRQLNA